MAKAKSILIGKRTIGKKNHVFFIAEAGVNHNGRLDLALKLVDVAKDAGADAIKFQTFKANQVVTCTGKMADYQKKNIGKVVSQQKMLKKFELPEQFYRPIIDRCNKIGILFLSAPHGGFASVDFLVELGVAAFKFGSGDLTNLPVLRYAAKFKKPIILSTGMATIKEVDEAVKCIKKAGNNKIIILHCTTDYPCNLKDVNLRVMLTLNERFKDLLVGYSDHTLGGQVSIMATMLGACIIEKHFTLDKNMDGPDHLASADPNELKEIICAIRNVPIVLGSKEKKPTKRELKIRPLVRKSLVAAKLIKKDQIIQKDDLAIKRPGTGLPPSFYDKVIGTQSKRSFDIDDQIKI